MSANSTLKAGMRGTPAPWLICAAGALVLAIPSSIDFFAGGLWSSDRYAHGPIVLAVGAWLIYSKRESIRAEYLAGNGKLGLGFGVLISACCAYAVGRSQEITILELGALIALVGGVILMLAGRAAVKSAAFGLLFMAFALPLPSDWIDAATGPMKQAVSLVTEALLSSLGYPIARAGVVLHVGRYQLLVADACAGLHTLFTLEALGLLYLNLVPHPSRIRMWLLAALIVPISFTANVIRVTALVLITYHLGDEAGQGFLHGMAGMVLFLAGLALTIAIDSLIRMLPVVRSATRVASA